MRKYLISLLLVIVAFPLLADERPRIAVLDFKCNESGMGSKFRVHRDEISAAVFDLFVTALVGEGKVTVIERERLKDILEEQRLGRSGHVSPTTAVKIGELLGVEYLLTGRITEFAYQNKSYDAFFKVGFKLKKQKLVGRLDTRLIRTDTGEVVAAGSGEKQRKFTNLRVATIGGGTDYDETMINDIFEPVVEEIAAKVSQELSKAPSSIGSLAVKEGKVIRIEGEKIFITLGERDGVMEGATFEVYRRGKALVDPDTGENLGAPENRLGSLKITAVAKKYSEATLLSGGGFKPDDLFKAE
jgi:curli biogenesis system outer membrane secretion channel CsgG